MTTANWCGLWLQLPSHTIKDAMTLAGRDGALEADFCVKTYTNADGFYRAMASYPAPENEADDDILWEKYVAGAHRHALGCFLLQECANTRPVGEVVDYAFKALREGALEAFSAARQAYLLRHPQQPLPELSDEEWANLQG